MNNACSLKILLMILCWTWEHTTPSTYIFSCNQPAKLQNFEAKLMQSGLGINSITLFVAMSFHDLLRMNTSRIGKRLA